MNEKFLSRYVEDISMPYKFEEFDVFCIAFHLILGEIQIDSVWCFDIFRKKSHNFL